MTLGLSFPTFRASKILDQASSPRDNPTAGGTHRDPAENFVALGSANTVVHLPESPSTFLSPRQQPAHRGWGPACRGAQGLRLSWPQGAAPAPLPGQRLWGPFSTCAPPRASTSQRPLRVRRGVGLLAALLPQIRFSAFALQVTSQGVPQGRAHARPASLGFPDRLGDLDSRSGSQGCAGAKQEPQLLSGNSNNVTPACILGGSESRVTPARHGHTA